MEEPPAERERDAPPRREETDQVTIGSHRRARDPDRGGEAPPPTARRAHRDRHHREESRAGEQGRRALRRAQVEVRRQLAVLEDELRPGQRAIVQIGAQN
jgi:hypothetical protein